MSDAIQMPADTSTTAQGGAAAADSGMEAVGEWLRHLRVTSTARHCMHKDGLYCVWHTRLLSFPQKYQQGQCPGKAVPKSSESF